MDHKKEIERITDVTIVLPDNDIRALKRKLQEYNDELIKYGNSYEDRINKVWERCKKLRIEMGMDKKQ